MTGRSVTFYILKLIVPANTSTLLQIKSVTVMEATSSSKKRVNILIVVTKLGSGGSPQRSTVGGEGKDAGKTTATQRATQAE